MKKIVYVLVLLFTVFSVFAQSSEPQITKNGEEIIVQEDEGFYNFVNCTKLEPGEFKGKDIKLLSFMEATYNDDGTRYFEYDSGPEVIPEYCFSDNYDLNSLHISQGTKRIEKSAFEHCGLTRLSFTDGVEYIGADAFSGSKLTVIKLPKLLKKIHSGAFTFKMYESSGDGINKIWIGEGVEIEGNVNSFFTAYKNAGSKAGWYVFAGENRNHRSLWEYLGE